MSPNSTDESSIASTVASGDCAEPHVPTRNVTVIHCWSAPRSRSTALLYSFEARSDCVAIDEPLSRLFHKSKSDMLRPYRDEFIAGIPPVGTAECDKWKWPQELLDFTVRIESAISKLKNQPEGVVFVKHLAKQETMFEEDKVERVSVLENPDETVHIVHKHVLLLRDPVAVLSSWGVNGEVHGNTVSIEQVGIVPMLGIYSKRPASKSKMVFLDSDDIVSDPEQTLTALCSELEIPWTTEMLTWESGPHECDGPWAPWWYKDLHKSSGWVQENKMTPQRRYRSVDPIYIDALTASMPAYLYLKSLTSRARRTTVHENPDNMRLLVWVGGPQGKGQLLPRDFASVSPWDSSVQGGDACWEGIRLYDGKLLELEEHLDGLFISAEALGFGHNGHLVHSKAEVKEAIFRTLAANGMRDGVYIQVTLTRGEKSCSSMNPTFNIYGTTLIVLAEWKPVAHTSGIVLITADQRCSPACMNPNVRHHNMINNILPKIQANEAKVADALMLDIDGYVSQTSSASLFMVKNGVLMTPPANDITRSTVLKLAKELELETEEKRIPLEEFLSADEVFSAGTLDELTPVTMIDGHVIGSGKMGDITKRLLEAYHELPDRADWVTDIPTFH